MSNLIQVMSKARKHCPSTPTEYYIEYVDDSITIYREHKGVMTKGTTFEIGDICEESSYNLSYYAVITKITDNSVLVAKDHNRGNRRMSLYDFCWRNHHFDYSDSITKNSEAMMYL